MRVQTPSQKQRLGILATHATETNLALARASLSLGVPATVMTPEQALQALRPGDVALGRLDVLPTLDGVEDGALEARPQPEDGVSYAPKITVEDARVDWSAPAFRVDRLIRACTPAPGAWTEFRGGRVKLGPVRPAPDAAALPPGTLSVTKDAVLVGTATHPVLLGEVRPQGKRAMTAAEWARGARIAEGDRFE